MGVGRGGGLWTEGSVRLEKLRQEYVGCIWGGCRELRSPGGQGELAGVEGLMGEMAGGQGRECRFYSEGINSL